MRVLNCMI